jgi:hypothetical protein
LLKIIIIILLLLLLLEDERSDWVNPIFDEREKCGEFHTSLPMLLEQAPKLFQYFRMGPYTFWHILHNIRPYIYIKKRKQGIDVLSTKLHDTLAYTAGENKLIWFRPSVGETCLCTSVQPSATETVST